VPDFWTTLYTDVPVIIHGRAYGLNIPVGVCVRVGLQYAAQGEGTAD